MDWIRWIALLQPIILTLALVFFRPEWISLLHEKNGTCSVTSSDIMEIQEKLKTLEEDTSSGKELEGLEESVSDLYRSIEDLKHVAERYSKQEGIVNNCNGSKTNIGIAVLALIQLCSVVCVAILWMKVFALQAAQKKSVTDMKANNNMNVPEAKTEKAL